MSKDWWKSKTVWGGVLYGIAQILRVVPGAAEVVVVVEAIAGVLGAVGVRQAIAANGTGN